MLRVVLDTSSLVSYVLTAGDIMRQVIMAWRAEAFVLLSSPQTRAELAAVLARPAIQQRAAVPLTLFTVGIARFSEHVPGELDLSGVCRDPKDDKFLACAVEGQAHYLVSSDRDLLDIGRYEHVCILNPGQFLVALRLSQLPVEALTANYSLDTLHTIGAELCLEPDTRDKLSQAIRLSSPQ